MRAKRRLRESGARFAWPDAEHVAARLPDAIAEIYAAYAAGAADRTDGGGSSHDGLNARAPSRGSNPAR